MDPKANDAMMDTSSGTAGRCVCEYRRDIDPLCWLDRFLLLVGLAVVRFTLRVPLGAQRDTSDL